MKILFHWFLALSLIFGSGLINSNADVPTTIPDDNSLALLPKSDVVAVLDVSRLVNDLLPKAKQAWPEQMAKFEKEISEVVSKAEKTGFDIYKIKSLTIGLKLFGKETTGAMIVEGLTITPEMMAKGDKDTRTVEYKGKTLYIEIPKPEAKTPTKTTVKNARKPVARSRTKAGAKAKPARAKASTPASGGIPVGDVTELASNMGTSLLKNSTAFVQLDTERVAFGDEPEVKAVIDALTGSADPANLLSNDLTAALQETRAPGLLRFALNIPDSARQTVQGEEFLKNLAFTKMVLGTLDITEDMSLLLDARLRTGSAEEATRLHESLAALLGLGKMMLGGNQDPVMAMLNTLLDQIQISPQTNDVALAITIRRELYETFLKSATKTTPAKDDK
jgi:hypothetical protein